MAGGQGTRLYPASTPDRPKQFFAPDGDRSLLRRTADRAAFADDIFAVVPPRYADQVGDTVPEADLLLEPSSRDTGPALVYAAHEIRDRIGNVPLVCLPSDHHITGSVTPTFTKAAAVARETDRLVTLGVEPDRPETGYGYIAPGEAIADGRAKTVDRFLEKPAAERASRLVDRGFLWNAGIFAWRPTTILEAARDSALAPLVTGLEGETDVATAYEQTPTVSIDAAVLEGADNLAVVPTSLEWDDVGSWDALARVFGDDLAGVGERIDSDGTVIASDGTHVSVLGAEDLIVAAYDDRVLVASRDSAQRVREVVERLELFD